MAVPIYSYNTRAPPSFEFPSIKNSKFGGIVMDLITLIKKVKENDEIAMVAIIDMFAPCVNKYYKAAQYNEDVRSELNLKLIQLVKHDIMLEQMREVNDATLIKYITSALYHHYISVSKKHRLTKNMEQIYESDESEMTDIDLSFSDVQIDTLFFEHLKSLLTAREYECVYGHVYMGYTSEELAKFLCITRQACNQCKQRAFKKLRDYYDRNGR
jgi:DNA-binding CsgD family transcriptional regulator